MPDINLHARHGSAALFAVVDVNAQGQRDATLGVAAIEVRADVTAIESGGAVVHEIRALFTFRSDGA
jgi:hypothetical protein